MFSISAVACFEDNYIWVLHQGSQAIAVDPDGKVTGVSDPRGGGAAVAP